MDFWHRGEGFEIDLTGTAHFGVADGWIAGLAVEKRFDFRGVETFRAQSLFERVEIRPGRRRPVDPLDFAIMDGVDAGNCHGSDKTTILRRKFKKAGAFAAIQKMDAEARILGRERSQHCEMQFKNMFQSLPAGFGRQNPAGTAQGAGGFRDEQIGAFTLAACGGTLGKGREKRLIFGRKDSFQAVEEAAYSGAILSFSSNARRAASIS